MKIAVLGSSGFIGSNLTNHLSKHHIVSPISRSIIDLLDPVAVKNYLKEKQFDIVINCAAVMTDNLTLHDARNNLGMFMNFYNNSNLFGKFINTGSGAEFDRTTNIDNAAEESLLNCMPSDSYGWGQNIKSRLCLEKNNFYTIRIFNCFGIGEPPTRIFPQFLSNKSIEINNDRYFDYFSIHDLSKVVDHCIDNNWIEKDVNAVYNKKYKISEVMAKFCDLNNLDYNFTVTSNSEHNYTGSGVRLSTLGIDLNGLDHGLTSYTKKD